MGQEVKRERERGGAQDGKMSEAINANTIKRFNII